MATNKYDAIVKSKDSDIKNLTKNIEDLQAENQKLLDIINNKGVVN